MWPSSRRSFCNSTIRAGRGRSAICSWPASTGSTASAPRSRRWSTGCRSGGSLRWLLEKLAGIDRRRSLPPLHADHFRRWFARHRPDAAAGTRGRVLLLDDCFTTYNEPAIGRAAVRVLEAAGYAVELADLACCGRPMISKGFLHRAASVDSGAGRRPWRGASADGTPLLGLEPSCLLTLADEWTELVPGPQTRTHRRRCPPGRRLAGRAGPGRTLPSCRCGRGRRRACCTATAIRRRWSAPAARPRRLRLVPRTGRDGARHRLLRHGRLVRLREGALRPERPASPTSPCCRRWRRRRKRSWSRRVRPAVIRSTTWPAGGRCTRWKCWKNNWTAASCPRLLPRITAPEQPCRDRLSDVGKPLQSTKRVRICLEAVRQSRSDGKGSHHGIQSRRYASHGPHEAA